jgi:hypothetical protein
LVLAWKSAFASEGLGLVLHGNPVQSPSARACQVAFRLGKDLARVQPAGLRKHQAFAIELVVAAAGAGDAAGDAANAAAKAAAGDAAKAAVVGVDVVGVDVVVVGVVDVVDVVGGEDAGSECQQPASDPEARPA